MLRLDLTPKKQIKINYSRNFMIQQSNKVQLKRKGAIPIKYFCLRDVKSGKKLI
jgi:hypothetical protein